MQPRGPTQGYLGETQRARCIEYAGSLVASEFGASGNLPSTVKSAKWAFSVQPELGWGEKGQKQRATAGWLASLPVFEPHWQVKQGWKQNGMLVARSYMQREREIHISPATYGWSMMMTGGMKGRGWWVTNDSAPINEGALLMLLGGR